MTEQYEDHSSAIKAAVQSWLSANEQKVLDAMRESFDKGIEVLASGIMFQVGKFLDENKSDISAAFAAALATSHAGRLLEHRQGSGDKPASIAGNERG